MREMCSKVNVSCHFICSSRPLAIASVTLGRSISSFSTPPSSSSSLIISSSALWSPSSSSGVCSRAAPDSYCASGVGNFFGRLEPQLVVPFEKCLWVPRGDSLGWQLKCGRRGDGARSALVTVQPDDKTGRSVGGVEKLVIAAEHGFQTKSETRGSSWGLPALSYLGGARVEHESSSRKTVFCTRRASGWLLGKRASGNFGKMELFKPQLMDTVPFRFLSEYHTTPPRAGKDGVSPIFFFGFGQAKPPVVEVVQAGDPVLHEPAAEVSAEEIGSARVEKIINDMVATMRNAPGVGLAAPQIGVPLQIIVLEDTKELMSYSSPEECEAQQRFPFDLLVIINPKLKTKSGSGSAIFFEGCLSVDGYRALVERDLDVEVTGLGRDGRPVHVEASGWKARILQHECDHLVGSLYVDDMVPKTFRTKENLRLPLPVGCPKPGVCKHSTKSLKL